jgi:stalled ribosome rescue protein Dom34
LVLVGQAHERTVVREAFGSGNGVRLLDVDRVASGDVRDTLDAAQERLSEEHAEHELDLVTTARDAAKSDGRGALGPADVTAALREGRVDHLLLSPDLELSGYVTDEGMLIFDQDTPGGQDATPESRFVHRMIERTITTDGKVTPVDGAAAEALEELGGVAAILRW